MQYFALLISLIFFTHNQSMATEGTSRFYGGQEFKISFGISKYYQKIKLPEAFLNDNYPNIDKELKDGNRGFLLGYGFEFFRGFPLSTTTSMNVGHYRNDFDRSSKTEHYRLNSSQFFLEQHINLNIEFQKITFRPFISYGIGKSYTQTSYRYQPDAQKNIHFQGKELTDFSRAGGGFMFIDKKKELFSFIRADRSFTHKTKQKMTMKDNSTNQLAHQNNRFKLENRDKTRGERFSFLIGAGAIF